MKRKKLAGTKKIKKILEEYTEALAFIGLVLIIIILIYFQKPLVGKAYTIIESEHIIASINLPNEIYVNEEFIVNIDLSVNGISNGILVSVDFPEELDVNSVNPSNAMITKNKIVWILAPYGHNLSFRIISNISGDYELIINFGTYNNNSQITEENSAIVLLNVTERPECETNQDCDDNNICTTDICVNNECNNSIIENCCLNDAECEDYNTCTTDNCVNNICENTPIDCDDGDDTTEDVCMYGGKCIHFKLAECLEDSECYLDDCTISTCLNGRCKHEPIECGVGYYCENGKCVSEDPCAGDVCDCDMCPQNCGPEDCGEPI